MGAILRTASAAVLMLGLAAAANGQYTAALRGVIHDSQGRPAPGVVVTVTHPAEPTVRVAVTNLRGEYVIRGLDPGTDYVVRVTHPNFRKERLEARAYASVREPIRVSLKPRRTAAER